jgi:arylsulfatase A-like enzyme
VDVCAAWSNYPEPRTLLERMEYQAIENLRFNMDPVSRRLFRPLTAHVFSAYWLRMNRALHHAASNMLDSLPRNSLVFVHYPLPHAPYVYDSQGGFTGDYKVRWGLARTDDEDRMLGTEAEYARHLVYLDKVVGGFVDELRRDGTWDDALVILTSDHHWRTEPDTALLRRSIRRVPLIVKLPGQRTGGVVDDSFPNTESWHFVEQTITGRSSDERVARLIARYGGGAATAVTPPAGERPAGRR